MDLRLSRYFDSFILDSRIIIIPDQQSYPRLEDNKIIQYKKFISFTKQNNKKHPSRPYIEIILNSRIIVIEHTIQSDFQLR
jgi:hypothetical protein